MTCNGIMKSGNQALGKLVYWFISSVLTTAYFTTMGERTLYCVFSDDKPKAPTRKEHVQQLITAAQESFLRLRPSKYPPQHATFKEEQLLN